MARIWALTLQFLLSFHHSETTSATNSSFTINPNSHSVDVAIIGGGAAGTYAAIRLHQLGHGIALIEKQSRLGGHVNTYVDPVTNKTFDYGVTGYDNTTEAFDFFSYLDVPTTPYVPPAGDTYVDLTGSGSGELLSSLPANINWGDDAAIAAAIPVYAAQFARYPFLANGGFNHLPTPIPEDLLLDTGTFLQKYNVTALAGLIWEQCEGAGNIFARPMLYTFQCASFSGDAAFVTTTAHDNQAIYDSAYDKLGGSKSVFLESTVLKISRSESQIKILFSSPSSGGGIQTLTAKKLILAIPPTLPSLKSLNIDLSPTESSLFAHFNYTYYWAMLVSNTGLVPSLNLGTIWPISLSPSSSPFGLPSMPTLLPLLPAESPSDFPQFIQAYYGSLTPLSSSQIKATVLAAIHKIISANDLKTGGEVEVVQLQNHAPYAVGVSTEEIKNGFYGKVGKLQGVRGTYYTGAVWHGEDSSGIWGVFEGDVLPDILEALKA